MKYADVAAAMLDPAAASLPVPAAVTEGSPARRLRDAVEPLSMHAVWSPLVHERMAARGLDFFGTYVWGRACVMGEPTGSVVAAAFAAFEPGMITAVYDGARSAMTGDDAWRITVDTTGESLRAVLAVPDGAPVDEAAVARVGGQLAAVIESLDATGRPLFAGVQSLPQPDDPFAALWQACLALREHRGDGHVAAYISAGFSPAEMNILTELWLGYPLGEYSGTRAWPESATTAALESLTARGLINDDALTAAGAQARGAIESTTDRAAQPVVDALGDDLDDITGQLAEWSARCIAAGTFPHDPRKRAAG